MESVFWTLWIGCALQRLAELIVSKRNQRILVEKGFAPAEPQNLEMIILHASWFVSMAAEHLYIRTSPIFPTWIPWTAATLFLLAQLLRFWTLRTLGVHWNISVMRPADGQVADTFVANGPYKFIRHPNYLVVCIELFTLPLVGSAPFTALIFALWNSRVLHQRMKIEDQFLFARPGYREAMGHKHAFFPVRSCRF